MIPILYEQSDTRFVSNGIVRLVDCISCIITEQRNGKYECEFEYPITGRGYSEILEGRIIAVIHSDGKDIQPFDIYKRSLPDTSGVVHFYARHIKYRQTNMITRPFTASDLSTALSILNTTGTVNPYFENKRFTFHTDITSAEGYEIANPSNQNAVFGELVEKYGGEALYDKFDTYLYANRGSDKGVEVRYGQNLISIKQEKDASDIYNAIAPYWIDHDENLVTVNGYIVTTQESQSQITPVRPIVMDVSSEFEEMPTQAQLQEYVENYLTKNKPWEIPETLEADFLQMWQTAEYRDIILLQTVELCDIVTVIYPDLNISKKLKVIEVSYNALLERYDKIILGTPEVSLVEYLKQ